MPFKFQMAVMRPTIKAFVSQACLHGFVVLLWVTLEDDVGPLKAVVKRSYQWLKFYYALPCIRHCPHLRLRRNFFARMNHWGLSIS